MYAGLSGHLVGSNISGPVWYLQMLPDFMNRVDTATHIDPHLRWGAQGNGFNHGDRQSHDGLRPPCIRPFRL